jgi:hypothetical protein
MAPLLALGIPLGLGVTAASFGAAYMVWSGGIDVGDLVSHDRHVTVPIPPVAAASKPASHIIYLNREGALLSAGEDEAKKNVSSIVKNARVASARIPAFEGNLKAWSAITSCIAEKFAPYDVTIVDQRPVEGSYIMGVVGGTPNDLGGSVDDTHGHEHAHDDHDHGVTGLAPFNGKVIPDAVVLIFSKALQDNPRDVCETAGMEIAHAYGLDHERDCHDLMSYLKPCGNRSFVNTASPCGEHADRACQGGQRTQNSHALLIAALGPRRR